MPLVLNKIYDSERIFFSYALWYITEPLSFFENQFPIIVEIKNELKKQQHIACRLALKSILPELNFNQIKYKDSNLLNNKNGKEPILINSTFHISFSHSDYFAFTGYSHFKIGIDVQIITPKIMTLKYKFLHPDEINILFSLSHSSLPFNDNTEILSMIWAIKEAAYKCSTLKPYSFKQNYTIQKDIKNDLRVTTLNDIQQCKVKIIDNNQSEILNCYYWWQGNLAMAIAIKN